MSFSNSLDLNNIVEIILHLKVCFLSCLMGCTGQHSYRVPVNSHSLIDFFTGMAD